MKSSTFRFKQFEIKQKINAQKIGSDSVLLGSLTNGSYLKILDIGTGTGLLALMMAQKFEEAEVVAIEPILEFYEEAKFNFNQSKFVNRISMIQTDFENYKPNHSFDLIISNPPYFINDLKSQNNNRNYARHADFSFELFYQKVFEWLSENGKLNIVIPYDIENYHLELASQKTLFPREICRTLSTNNTFKRSVISFSKEFGRIKESEISVKNKLNGYSKEYIDLTKDFYTKDLRYD